MCNTFAPVEALYLVLHQILAVLYEVPKHHNLVRTERFLLWFHISCLGFHMVRVLSKIADAVNEEFLIFFECHCKCSQYSTICCLPLTIMEFRAQIQMTDLIQELFHSSTSWTWLTAMHHAHLVIWVTDNFLDQIFAYILPVNHINQQYCILMSAIYANRMSAWWSNKDKPFWS